MSIIIIRSCCSR